MIEVTQEMREKFLRGEYVFSAPPVCPALWDINSWCRYVTFTKGGNNASQEESIKEETPQR